MAIGYTATLCAAGTIPGAGSAMARSRGVAWNGHKAIRAQGLLEVTADVGPRDACQKQEPEQDRPTASRRSSFGLPAFTFATPSACM